MIRAGKILIAVLVVAAAGCSKGRAEPERYPVTGTVTLDGKPMPDGRIYFVNVQAGLNDAVDIKDGKFEGQVPAGEKTVQISRLRTLPPKPNDPMKSEIQEETIAAKYNTKSALKATVTEAGPNEFKFEVTSK